MKAYHIFNDINVRQDKVRIQGWKKRTKISNIQIRKLQFTDQTVWFFEIGKYLRIFSNAEEFEALLLSRGASMIEYHSSRTYDSNPQNWGFDVDLSVTIDARSSREIRYWTIEINRQKSYNLYGEHPLEHVSDLIKHYEGDTLPSAKDFPGGEIPKNQPSQAMGCLLAFLIFALAAILYTTLY